VTTTADQDAAWARAAGKAGRWIAHWRPEDAGFWARGGARIARRNLVLSIFSEHVGFSVWSLWSARRSSGAKASCGSPPGRTRTPPGTTRRMANAVIGIADATGAAGGVLVNIAFRQSFLASGTGNAAYVGFIAFYVICVCLTWLCCLRAGARRGFADV
jgi:nitrate/nitrite transporter NarK